MADLTDRTLHVGCPNIGDREVFERLVDEMFSRRWFTNRGPIVQEFESRLCQYLGVRNCIAICNATIGLQIAYKALGLTGEVIVPAFTFPATAHALCWEGIRPVFCEIDAGTHNLDPSRIEELISDNTTAIVGVHVWGRPCDTEAIQKIADRHRLKVIYDAAHAFGCQHRGKMIGNFGSCEVFSFHATKFFNTFEGGAIATNDDELAESVRLMVNFGFKRMDEVVQLGTNGKMPEICAAMGLACFEKLSSFFEVNRRHFSSYRRGLAGIPGVNLIDFENAASMNCQYVVVDVNAEQAGLSRDQLVENLHRRNIRARRYFFPGCHRMEPYRSENFGPWSLPITDQLCDRVLQLPTGTSISDSDVEFICSVIRGIIADRPH